MMGLSKVPSWSDLQAIHAKGIGFNFHLSDTIDFDEDCHIFIPCLTE
jgi:hypothetical protein